ncbi:hypothetical protein DL766_008167 [Monosporascus sp. MC13-8B]|uniref:Uncharacterized protein n=1 Tax=Monosporascus cannonballus TaxID=155416 RepID=A0ABY0GRZ0_9PEZI|nr:hypothetical protein DL762_010225 [Monosporascus cannonballus]RYO82853.1 hypothetical protein DL763_008085 [Monosporascus cannonballus]RYP20534.1 hypothetical protein DL766_008167 [Monosporascus sp. MC13-8B]
MQPSVNVHESMQYGDLPVEGTIQDWGTSTPSLDEVLAHYQALFDVQPPLSRPGRGPNRDYDDNDNGNARGSGWKKEVMRDDYGGYFYIGVVEKGPPFSVGQQYWSSRALYQWITHNNVTIGEDDEYHACDFRGNKIETTDKRTGYRTSNPRGIVLVFVNSQKQTYYYYHGRAQLCSLNKDPKSGTYYVVDDKGRERDAQYVGKMPRRIGSRQSASRSSQGQSPAYGSSLTCGSNSAYGSSFRPSQVKCLIDPKSGKRYYVGDDGKSHWV